MFSIGAGTTAVLMPKRQCLVVSSRSVRRQPEKLGRRWWKVWNFQAIGASVIGQNVPVSQNVPPIKTSHVDGQNFPCGHMAVQNVVGQKVVSGHPVIES